MKVKIENNNNVSSRGRGSNVGWIVNDVQFKLACTTSEEVQVLINDVENCIDTYSDFYAVAVNNSPRDILKIASLLIKEKGQIYLYKRIYKLAKEIGEFNKDRFMESIIPFKNKHELSNLHKDNDISEFLSEFEGYTKKAYVTIFDIEGHLERNEPFVDIVDKIVPGKIIRYCYHEFLDLFIEYFGYFCRQYTLNFKVVHVHSVLRDIFGRDNSVAQGAKTGQTRDIELIYKELHTIANKEYEYQCSYFPKMNNKRLFMEQDKWTMYFMRGVSLKGREIDFSKIKSSTLRYEIKLYYRECVLKYRKNFEAVNSNINLVAESINFLTDICPYVKHFADVDITHAVAIENFLEYDCLSYKNESLSVQTVASIFSELRGVIDFLKENALEQYELGITVYYPVPQANPFREVKFVNLANMQKNTEVIPEEVMNQLLAHKDEMKSIHQLEFSIMNDTAMRAKEVLMLEADCLNGSTNEIYYIPYKTVSARRKKALPDRRLNYITDDVRILIEEQIDKTSELREKFNIPYIFINDTNAISSMMPSSAGFCYAINKLIEKYDIRDYDNNLWRFNCRQSRKTVARTMILNDATPMEIMAVLGHANPNTAYKHYEELEKMKLEDMNTDFYKKQFEVSIGEENLANFSEEERRALYIDFRLSYRDVELGKCTKGFHEKPCGKITGKISCGLCSKCATGKKYLPEWIKLKNSQEILVKELVMNFEKENITGYEDFVEYKREVYFLDTYTDVVQRLENERD